VSPGYRPPAGPVRILHGDRHIAVVTKPPGLLSVPGRGADKADCLEARVAALMPGARAAHRLDMETSGLMVLARTAAAHRTLSMAFADRRIEKAYVAEVAGRMQAQAGEIDLPLITDWPNRPRQKVDPEAGKPSLTRYRRLSVAAGTSRVRLVPVTGRSHQLRVHLAEIGHPILGDRLYAPPQVCEAAPRLQLHAETLGFAHPETGAPLRFCAPAPF
jgi:tRNA pseudouridine32 synthase/23S rRNA pseudouridine746 synthase